jgi:3-oxoacyl-[acyl-carrier protein] reductase
VTLKVDGLAGKVVLVTGGSSGIGRATCEAFAEQGARVAIHAFRGVDRAQVVANKIRMAGGSAKVFIGDLMVSTDIDRLIPEVVEAFGGLDVLVNNAGDPIRRARFVDIDEELLELSLALNFKAPFLLSRRAVEALGNTKGNIVNVSTAATRRVAGGLNLHYSSAKGALNTLTCGLAMELGPLGIRVNCVAPGLVDTELHQRLSNSERLAVSSAKQIIKRAATPEEIANAIVYFGSPAAAFITGQIFFIDGG